MCIAFLCLNGKDSVADCPFSFAVASNRDEFHARPSLGVHVWPGSGIYAGKDCESSGTWFGVTKEGRFAVITNYRELEKQSDGDFISRGGLALGYLSGDTTTEAYATHLLNIKDQYQGFNLIFGDLRTSDIRYVTNRYTFEAAKASEEYPIRVEEEVALGSKPLSSGFYGLSNALLDTAWPKVERGKSKLINVLKDVSYKDATFDATKKIVADRLLKEVLSDAEIILADDNKMVWPKTGWTKAMESALSSTFVKPFEIHSKIYGTRASTVVLVNKEMTELVLYEYGLYEGKWNLREHAFSLDDQSSLSPSIAS